MIFAVSVGFYVTSLFTDSLDLSLITRIGIVLTPLAVSASCFLLSKNYGNSKIFGKSYLLLGLGFFISRGIPVRTSEYPRIITPGIATSMIF